MILATRSVAKTFSMWLGSRLVLPFQLVLRKWRSEVSERRTAAHQRSDRRLVYPCADGLRKRAHLLIRHNGRPLSRLRRYLQVAGSITSARCAIKSAQWIDC